MRRPAIGRTDGGPGWLRSQAGRGCVGWRGALSGGRVEDGLVCGSGPLGLGHAVVGVEDEVLGAVGVVGGDVLVLDDGDGLHDVRHVVLFETVEAEEHCVQFRAAGDFGALGPSGTVLLYRPVPWRSMPWHGRCKGGGRGAVADYARTALPPICGPARRPIGSPAVPSAGNRSRNKRVGRTYSWARPARCRCRGSGRLRASGRSGAWRSWWRIRHTVLHTGRRPTMEAYSRSTSWVTERNTRGPSGAAGAAQPVRRPPFRRAARLYGRSSPAAPQRGFILLRFSQPRLPLKTDRRWSGPRTAWRDRLRDVRAARQE